MQVTIESTALTIVLTSPLDNLVGFERAPRNEAENRKVRDMATQLRKEDAVFKLDALAGCTLESVALTSDALSPDLLGQGGAAASKGASGDGHAELHATWQYRCGDMSKLRSIEVRLFQYFRGLKRIKAAALTARGQKAAELTAKAAQLNLQ